MKYSTKTFARSFASIALMLALAGSTFAQQPAVQPVRPEDVPEAVRKAFEEQQRKKAEEAANPKPVAVPTTQPAPVVTPPIVRKVPTVTSTDVQVQTLVQILVGHKMADAAGDRPALSLGAAVATIEGLDNAVYFEVARADDLARPFRSGLWHVYTRKGQLRVRQFEVRNGGNATLAYANLWAVPEVLPTFKLDQLAVVLDMPVASGSDGYTATTSEPFPSTTAGATEVSSTWKLSPTGVTFDDTGFDASGKKVFGSGAVAFKNVSTPSLAVKKYDTGVVAIDIVPPTAEAGLVASGEAAVHYTGWLAANGNQFATSREANARSGNVEPLRFTHGNMIPGFNESILGINRGTIRRLYIPAAMGYGARSRGTIPANSDLIFLIETLWTKAPEPKAETPAVQPAVTPAQPAAQPAAQPGASAQPAIKTVSENEVPLAVREAFKKQQEEKAKKLAEEAAKKAEEAKKAAEEAMKKAEPATSPK